MFSTAVLRGGEGSELKLMFVFLRFSHPLPPPQPGRHPPRAQQCNQGCDSISRGGGGGGETGGLRADPEGRYIYLSNETQTLRLGWRGGGGDGDTA